MISIKSISAILLTGFLAQSTIYAAASSTPVATSGVVNSKTHSAAASSEHHASGHAADHGGHGAAAAAVSSTSVATTADLPKLSFQLIDSHHHGHSLGWDSKFPITGVVHEKKHTGATTASSEHHATGHAAAAAASSSTHHSMVADDKKAEGWSLALARTYIRAETLAETLHKNGLDILKSSLTAKMAERGIVDKINPEALKPPAWQVMYIGKESSGHFAIEAIGFIQGDMNSLKPEKQPIFYISLHHSNAEPEFIKSPSGSQFPGHFIKVDVTEEIRSIISKHASSYYPRYICKQGVKSCFAGHAALTHFALNAPLNPETGQVPNSHNYLGFTLIGHGGASASPATHHTESHSGAATSSTAVHGSSSHAAASSSGHTSHSSSALSSSTDSHPAFKINTTTGTLRSLPTHGPLFEEIKKTLTALLGGASIS